MTKKIIESAIAKEELQRINDALAEPVLIVGGLAVQQYSVGRDSKDIDIVCSHNVAKEIVRKLYPSENWYSEDVNHDDYRPSIRIRHHVEDRGEIVLGPKILERENYQYIEWDLLKHELRPFNYKNNKLLNIQVPSPDALAFTKLLSFIDRKSKKEETKSRQDLQDFVDLSNNNGFSLIRFLALVTPPSITQHIRTSLANIAPDERTLFDKSSLSKIQELFGITSTSAGPVGAGPTVMKPISSEIAKIALKHQGKPLHKTTARELLLVVDIQNDFCDGGALAAQDTKSLIDPLNLLIRKAEEAELQVVFTRDWHLHDHYSFKDWGPHCVKDTTGAAFHPNLYLPPEALIVDIGTSNEMDGYSPFHDPTLQALVSSPTVHTIYIVGLALEFCILAACRDAAWFGKTVIAVDPYIRSATHDVSEREAVWNLIESLGVVRGRNIPLRMHVE
jgi:nicotinamidase/pyrazinamidase